LREDIEGFNRELMEYLIWYNTERVHSGIGGKAPSLKSYGRIQTLYKVIFLS